MTKQAEKYYNAINELKNRATKREKDPTKTLKNLQTQIDDLMEKSNKFDKLKKQTKDLKRQAKDYTKEIDTLNQNLTMTKNQQYQASQELQRMNGSFQELRNRLAASEQNAMTQLNFAKHMENQNARIK